MTGTSRRPPGLADREAEREVLEAFLGAVSGGTGQVLVLRGDPGVGKTALLGHAVERARDCRVVRAVGVQSEMELPFAGLRQLCAPLLAGLERLPAPQRTALRTALGLGEGPPPDRFLLGLAALTLLADAAEQRPLVCVVDDAQWLDAGSAQVLGFVARRLAAESVGLLLAARDPGPHLAGLPVLEVTGLRHEDARSLLDAALPTPLDADVRAIVLAEAQGNPLALLELPRSMTPAELAGGFGFPAAVPLAGRLEEGFRRRLAGLPEPTRRLLQLAAADPSGDPVLVHRAAERLGIPVQAAGPAIDAGLVEFGVRLSFRHPLVRSAAYLALPEQRREAHAALAEATDPLQDPDRRAWHRAHAAAGHDESVAAELEQAAERAQRRGGMAAAAAFLQRSVELTTDPGRRAERALAAASATTAAGAFARALELLDVADAGPLDALPRARADLLRARVVFVSGVGGEAPALLLRAATRLAPLDTELARDTYLEAWMAASFAGRGDDPTSGQEEIARAVRALPPPARPRPVDLVLDGLALLSTEGRLAAAPVLHRAAARFAAEDIPREQGLRYGWNAAALVWDDAAAHSVQEREARLAREAGALDELPFALVALAMSQAWRGDFATAAALVAETDAICEITQSRIVPCSTRFLAALRGDPAEVTALVEAARAEARETGQQSAATCADWTWSILENGRGRHDEAFAAASRAVEDAHLYVSMWALPELVEAAVRVGRHDVARTALDQLRESTTGGTDFGLGLEARCRALLGGPDAADAYEEAADRLERAGIRTEAARAHLLHGESLRSDGHRSAARTRLRTAHEMLHDLGMAAFAERARRALAATGEPVPSPAARRDDGLTAQEALIAGLAVQGLSNAEIGAQLYLSGRTVEWHLRKVFVKLGVTSRRELRGTLPSRRPPDAG